MKCKICGYEANQGASSCPMCGSRLSGIMLDDSDFSWNTKDFPKPKELHDINMRWTLGELEPVKPEASMAEDASEGYVEIPDQEEEAPAETQETAQTPPQSPGSPLGAWNMPLWYTQGEGMRPFTASGYINIQSGKDGSAPQSGNESSKSIYDDLKTPEVSPFPEMPKSFVNGDDVAVDEAWLAEELGIAQPEEKKEQFPTFVRKNEEFQALLNKEYERANSLNLPVRPDEEPRRTHTDVFGHDDVIKAEDLSAFERMLLEGTEDGGSDKTLVLNRERSVSRQSEDPLDSMPKDTLSGTGSLSWSKMLEEMEAEKLQRKTVEAVQPENEAAPVSSAADTEGPADHKPADGAVRLNKDTIEMKLAQMRAKDMEDKEKRSERRRKLDEMAKAREQFFFDMDEQTPPGTPEPTPISEKLNEVFKEDDERRRAEEAAAAEKQEKKAKKKKKADDDFMKPKKRHGFLIFLLIIVVLLGLCYGTYWGVNKYAPDSIASDMVNQIAGEVMTYWQRFIDKANDVISFYTGDKIVQSNEKDQEFTTDDLTEEEIGFEQLVRAADPEGIIKSVRNSNSLLYKVSKEYKVKGLGEMEVVKDQKIRNAICSAMIGYNASWVKFVNDGDSACLDYLKADGAAYRSAVAYELIGEITESFDSLELGEIRTDGTYYYVFDKEDVTITQGESVNSVSSEMLYRLELVGSKYKIVDYSEI